MQWEINKKICWTKKERENFINMCTGAFGMKKL